MNAYRPKVLLGLFSLALLVLLFVVAEVRRARPTKAGPVEDQSSSPTRDGSPPAVDPGSQAAALPTRHAASQSSSQEEPDELSRLRTAALESASWAEVRDAIARLAELGTEDATRILLECIADTDPYFTHKADFLADALKDTADDRIPLAAASALRQSIENGRDDWTALGYAKLIVAQGTSVARQELVSYINDDTVALQLRVLMAGSLGRANDPQLATMLLEQARAKYSAGDVAMGNAFAQSLVACDDAQSALALLAVARDAPLDLDSQRSIYATWGRSLKTSEDIAQLNAEWSSGGDTRELVLDALGGALQTGVSPTDALQSALPMLSQALSDGSTSEFLSALSIVDDNRKYAPSELANVLLAAAGRAPEEVYRKRALAIAKAIQQRGS